MLTGSKSGANAAVYISESATPEILGYEGLAADTGSLTFSDDNARATVTAPPAADIAASNPLGI